MIGHRPTRTYTDRKMGSAEVRKRGVKKLRKWQTKDEGRWMMDAMEKKADRFYRPSS